MKSLWEKYSDLPIPDNMKVGICHFNLEGLYHLFVQIGIYHNFMSSTYTVSIFVSFWYSLLAQSYTYRIPNEFPYMNVKRSKKLSSRNDINKMGKKIIYKMYFPIDS